MNLSESCIREMYGTNLKPNQHVSPSKDERQMLAFISTHNLCDAGEGASNVGGGDANVFQQQGCAAEFLLRSMDCCKCYFDLKSCASFIA